MGRTLHYELKPQNGRFTKKDLEKLYDVGRMYQQQCEWTCESLDIDPYSVYPNWSNNNDAGCKAGWDKLTKRQNEIAQTGRHHNEICQQLVKEGIASYHAHHDKPQYGFGGFTKTGGNELNSLQVVMALLAASRIVKTALIYLSDEGELLKCPLIIKQGKARPNIEEIDSNIAHCLGSALFNPAYEDCKDNLIEHAKRRYEVKEQYRMDDLNEIYHDISLFVRPVNPEDFKEYPEYNAGQIMAGFEGEYFGLAKQDPEAASYRMIAMFQKLLPKDGDLKLEVCPKLNA